MKSFNSNAFFKACSGIALILIAAAAFSFSIKPASASPTSFTRTFPAAGNGKYQYNYVMGLDNSGNGYWHMIITNTETGGYKAYRWDVDDQNWKKMFADCIAFPELP